TAVRRDATVRYTSDECVHEVAERGHAAVYRSSGHNLRRGGSNPGRLAGPRPMLLVSDVNNLPQSMAARGCRLRLVRTRCCLRLSTGPGPDGATERECGCTCVDADWCVFA